MNGLFLVIMGMVIGSFVYSTRSVIWIGVGMIGFALAGDVVLGAIGPYLGSDINEVLALIYSKVAI